MLKVRCCVVELAEAEQTLAFYHRKKLAVQNKLYQLKAELDKQEIEFYQYVEDREIQLVMKMGQVEVPICGQGLDDFTDVVLISRREFLSTNEEIKKADKQKLTAIIKSVNLRKKISYQKCRHECLRYTLKYLQEELKSISEVKVSKYIYIHTYICIPSQVTIVIFISVYNILNYFIFIFYNSDNERITKILEGIFNCEKSEKRV